MIGSQGGSFTTNNAYVLNLGNTGVVDATGADGPWPSDLSGWLESRGLDPVDAQGIPADIAGHTASSVEASLPADVDLAGGSSLFWYGDERRAHLRGETEHILVVRVETTPGDGLLFVFCGPEENFHGIRTEIADFLSSVEIL